MKGPWKMLALLIAVGVVAGASIAVAAPSSSSSKSSTSGSSSGSGTRERFEHRGPGRGEDLSALAGKLGVSATKLRSALEAVRNDVKPPSRNRTQPPTRAQIEATCTKLTDALGAELGKSGDDVRSASKEVAKDRLAADVKAGRLTQAQADAIEKRIDSSACPPIGFHGPGPGGCHGGHGHGPGGPGDGDGRGPFGGPPPGAPNGSGDNNGDSGTSTPSAAPQSLAI
jgi:hypothetical protein